MMKLLEYATTVMQDLFPTQHLLPLVHRVPQDSISPWKHSQVVYSVRLTQFPVQVRLIAVNVHQEKYRTMISPTVSIALLGPSHLWISALTVLLIWFLLKDLLNVMHVPQEQHQIRTSQNVLNVIPDHFPLEDRYLVLSVTQASFPQSQHKTSVTLVQEEQFLMHNKQAAITAALAFIPPLPAKIVLRVLLISIQPQASQVALDVQTVRCPIQLIQAA